MTKAITSTIIILNFSDRLVFANSGDPDQTAARGESYQGLHCLLFHLHLFGKIP